MGVYQFHREQKLPATIDDVWEFISSPGNLKRITPDYMGFDIITSQTPEEMYPGMIIMYKVSPVFNQKMIWVSEITQMKEKEYFVDEQRKGPYKIWHHEHKISPIENGVLMTDLVTYQPPMGFIGNIANQLIIRKKLNEIFLHRKKVLEEIFGTY